MDSRLICHVYLLVLIYSFISSIFFLSNSKTYKVETLYTHGQWVDLFCIPNTNSQNLLVLLFFFFFSVCPINTDYKLASTKLFHQTSDGYDRGYVSFAHCLLYLALPCSLSSCFFSRFSIVITSLGEEGAVYVLLVYLFIYTAGVGFCPFSLRMAAASDCGTLCTFLLTCLKVMLTQWFCQTEIIDVDDELVYYLDKLSIRWDNYKWAWLNSTIKCHFKSNLI